MTQTGALVSHFHGHMDATMKAILALEKRNFAKADSWIGEHQSKLVFGVSNVQHCQFFDSSRLLARNLILLCELVTRQKR